MKIAIFPPAIVCLQNMHLVFIIMDLHECTVYVYYM